MKLELLLEDGTTMTVEGVVSFKEINTQESIWVANTPTESKFFEVNPLQIDRSKFEKPLALETEQRNPMKMRQEGVRKLIQEAFAEVDKQPEKYGKTFYTMFPAKFWIRITTIEELESYACGLGGQMADWVEQALEWAQRISNGETWENVCNEPDTARWHRVIINKNNCFWIVGGSRLTAGHLNYPATQLCGNCLSSFPTDNAVPLVRFESEIIHRYLLEN